jgi:tRNA A-37 threonylcarbamoyl transferase component Bud32
MLRIPPVPEGYRRHERGDGRVWVLREGFPLGPDRPEWENWLAGRGGRPAAGAAGRAPIRIIDLPGWGEAVVRRCHHGGALAAVTRDRLWGPRRPLRELAVSATARERGVPTPELLAVYLHPAGGPIRKACVVSRRIPEGTDLRAWIRSRSRERRARRALLMQVARAVSTLHAAGCDHADLNLGNLLLAPSGLFILDLDGARICARPLPVARRGGNLLRLHRSLRKETAQAEPLSAAECLRFLRAYSGEDGRLYRDLGRWLLRRLAFSGRRLPNRSRSVPPHPERSGARRTRR